MCKMINQAHIPSPEFDRAYAMGYNPGPNDQYRFFAEQIFPVIDGKPYDVLYSIVGKGADPIPNEVKVACLILSQYEHMPLKDFAYHLQTDVAYQVAIHCAGYGARIPKLRCLLDFKHRLKEYYENTGEDLIHNTFSEMAEHFADVAGVDLDRLRFDSFLLEAYIKGLSRYELIYRCVEGTVKVLNEEGIELDDQLKHFLDPADLNIKTYHDKDTAEATKMDRLLAEAQLVRDTYGNDREKVPEFDIFNRCLYEQTTCGEDGKLRLREKGDPILRGYYPEVDEDPVADGNQGKEEETKKKRGILQSPVDPDATFNGKRGETHRGYSVTVAEAAVKDKKGGIIRDYYIDQNIVSDNQEALAIAQKLAPAPSENAICAADATFNGASFRSALTARNYTLINTNLTGRPTPDCFADLQFGEDRLTVTACPGGCTPTRTALNKNGSCSCWFDKSACAKCPHNQVCHPKQLKKADLCQRTFSAKQKSRALSQRKRSDEQFSEISHFRNGIEALFSFLRRAFLVDSRQYRGIVSVTINVGIILLAANCRKFYLRMTS